MNCQWGVGWGLGWGWPLLLSAYCIIGVLLVFFFKKRPIAGPTLTCPGCQGTIQAVYIRCPYCGYTLKSTCPDCFRLVESNWHYCPDCRAQLDTNTAQAKTPHHQKGGQHHV